MASKYCFQAHLQSADPPHGSWNGLKVAFLNVPPAEDDPRVFAPIPDDYIVKEDDDGKWVHIQVRFYTEEDATEFFDDARALNGIFVACKQNDAGSSYMHVHECFRDNLGCRIISAKEIKSV